MTDHLMTDTQPSLIEVMAPHCAECRAMQPELDAVANEFHETVDLIVINAAEEPERAVALEVLGTPTLIAMRNGVEVARFTGRRSKTELRELFVAVADGTADSISSMSGSDRLVWTVAAVLLTAAGLAIGPSWIMVVLGVGLGSYALVRGRR